MKLGRNEARLLFHEPCIVLPGLEEGLLVGLIEQENVNQYDRPRIGRELTVDRECWV